MKLCRFRHEARTAWAVMEGDDLAVLSGAPFEGGERTGEVVPLERATLLAPCVPSKIVGVGLNYRAHAEELKAPLPRQPLLFLKPPSAVLDPEGAIVLPPESTEVHYEGELGVVIGRLARRVTPPQAQGCILGFTCVNDVTARDLQRAEVQYTRAKGFDTFAPVGPVIETDLDPRALTIQTAVNGEVRQRGATSDMIFDVFELVAFASRGMTLMPGDVLTTGTPPGVGPLRAGDCVEVGIEGIGVLRSRVVSE